jgi:DNA sulfur modification protein DndD
MHLRSISLRDWKAFEKARFDFPAPSGKRNTVLIGGQNGFGKTSLFEAIVLTLFGRDGLPLIARAPFGGTDERLSTNYREFLSRAIHGTAIKDGRTNCSATLVFEDDDKTPIELQRTWHFTGAGTLRQSDSETVTIYRGIERKSVGPGRNESDPIGWYRDWISRTFLPSHLAAFFMFDGEDAARFAELEMSTQVRQGIEGLLGLPWLRLLADDLRKYAANRRSQVPQSLNSTITKTQSEIDEIEKRLLDIKQLLLEKKPEQARLSDERSRLTRELQQFGGASQAQLGELIQQKERSAREIETARSRLNELISTNFAIALSGKGIRTRVMEQLRKEKVREGWEATVRQGAGNLERYLSALGGELDGIEPSLLPPQKNDVASAARRVWDTLWNPAPTDCAEVYRHTHLVGADRDRVMDRLRSAEGLSVRALSELLERMAEHAAIARNLDAQIASAQSAAPNLDERSKRLRELNQLIGVLDREIGAAEQAERSLKPELDQKRKALANYSQQIGDSKPAIRRANRAETMAAMIDQLVEKAVPGQVDAVAKEMTAALLAMAHRPELLSRVEIGPDCSVRLLNRAGRDMRDFDLSAGEKQIFAQALISAVVKVSGRVFPMIVDTPLGRLDVEHRKGVLKHVTGRSGQIVLISTDTEVVGPYLDGIRGQILKSYRIDNRRDGDLGTSWPVEGYFEGQGL